MNDDRVSEPAQKAQMAGFGLLEDIEGLDDSAEPWGDYPLNVVLIRSESRTVHDALRRIARGEYIMNPDFQREFVWSEEKQSRLIESVIMRIPLPVFYLAEDNMGNMVVVDGLQRLSTFARFINDELKLNLPKREEIHNKRFSELPPKYQNRIEDSNLIMYAIDSKVPERARLDIFERVNNGEPLTRQQMRNSLYMGPATRFLKQEAKSDLFISATGNSLNKDKMRDREFVNRFCAYYLFGVEKYNGDMDTWLAECLRQMNKMEESELERISFIFRQGLSNNYHLFRDHAFRKYNPGQTRRSVINAALWDVMSTGLCKYEPSMVNHHSQAIQNSIYGLLQDEKFQNAISFGTNNTKKVKARFSMAHQALEEVLGAHSN